MVIHLVISMLAAYSVFQGRTPLKAFVCREGVNVRGGGGWPPAFADKGRQCEIVLLAGLTVEGLQEESRRTGLRTNGLRAELVARVDGELRRRAT